MSDPYEELRKLKIRLASIEQAASGIDPATRVFTTKEIEDSAFWRANKDAITKAAAEGRIVESEPVTTPPPVVYGPSGFPGLRQTGPNMYETTDKAPKTEGER